MKRYIYPMVLFTDENESYTALYPDLNLLASGYSIEDVYARANEYLSFYITSALKYETSIVSGSTYSEIQSLNPSRIVLLGSTVVDEDVIVLTDDEQVEKNFLNEFIFTEGNDNE